MLQLKVYCVCPNLFIIVFLIYLHKKLYTSLVNKEFNLITLLFSLSIQVYLTDILKMKIKNNIDGFH
jgi:hypothetical protein